jgi:hypothetical protein
LHHLLAFTLPLNIARKSLTLSFLSSSPPKPLLPTSHHSVK